MVSHAGIWAEGFFCQPNEGMPSPSTSKVTTPAASKIWEGKMDVWLGSISTLNPQTYTLHVKYSSEERTCQGTQKSFPPKATLHSIPLELHSAGFEDAQSQGGGRILCPHMCSLLKSLTTLGTLTELGDMCPWSARTRKVDMRSS